MVETRRAAPSAGSDLGGGLGDVNASGRYDFHLAGDSPWVPGVAALAGVTLPTGRPPEKGRPPLAADATGIGAYQLNVGLALEQVYGPWLLNATAIVAKRTARSVQGIDSELGTQLTALAAVGYTLAPETAVALVASYALEGDANVNGHEVAGSARRVPTVSVAGVWPFVNRWRLQGSVFASPPIASLGQNQPASIGLTTAFVRSFW
jgi:hypothetical protein